MAYITDTFINDSPDDKLLRAFVTSAVKVLSAIVNGDAPTLLPPERVSFTHPEAQKWFQHNWNGFKEAADRVVGSLRNIAGNVWEKLHNAGLTLGHLKMKWQLLYQDLLTGKFNNILRRLDSILKSLASVIHLAECLAEYKEHVELTIDKLQDLNVDCTELIDLDLAS